MKTSTKKKRTEGLSLPSHKHCVICGGVVPPDKNPPVCEGQCEEELIKREKRSRTFNLIWMLMIFGFITLIFISFLLAPR